MIKVQKGKQLRKKLSIFLVASTILAQTVSSALADWRSDMGVFRIGIVAKYEEPFDASKLELFRAIISDALKMPVELFQARDISALIDATASSRIEYAIMSAIGYATLETFCDCSTPLAAPLSQAGASSVRSVFIANSKKISSLDQIAEKRIAIGPDTSVTGSMLPKAQFRAGGKSLAQSGAILVRTASVEEALGLFTSGEVDGFFSWEAVNSGSDRSFGNAAEEQLKRLENLDIATLWFSEPVRFGPHVVRKNLPLEAVRVLRSTLLSLAVKAPLAYDAVSPDLGGGFQAVSEADYTSALRLAQSLTAK